MPTHTNKPNEKSCSLRNSMLSEYWNFVKNVVFKLHCQIPCATMGVTFPSLSHGNGSPDEAFAELYLHHVIKVQTSFWSYSIISLLAEVGGYVGLLLGMSLLDVKKVIQWLFTFYNSKHS